MQKLGIEKLQRPSANKTITYICARGFTCDSRPMERLLTYSLRYLLVTHGRHLVLAGARRKSKEVHGRTDNKVSDNRLRSLAGDSGASEPM